MVDIDSISKKWSEQILLRLNDGPKRFNQLMSQIKQSDKGISSRTLAIRLKKLEEERLIDREILDERPPTTIYKITEKGKKALDLVIKLNRL